MMHLPAQKTLLDLLLACAAAMNATILAEVIAAALLLAEVVRQLARGRGKL